MFKKLFCVVFFLVPCASFSQRIVSAENDRIFNSMAVYPNEKDPSRLVFSFSERWYKYPDPLSATDLDWNKINQQRFAPSKESVEDQMGVFSTKTGLENTIDHEVAEFKRQLSEIENKNTGWAAVCAGIGCVLFGPVGGALGGYFGNKYFQSEKNQEVEAYKFAIRAFEFTKEFLNLDYRTVSAQEFDLMQIQVHGVIQILNQLEND